MFYYKLHCLLSLKLGLSMLGQVLPNQNRKIRFQLNRQSHLGHWNGHTHTHNQEVLNQTKI